MEQREMERYQFNPEVRAFLEAMPIPFSIYQYLDHQAVALLVSDATVRFFGYDCREEVIQQFNTFLYPNAHPDDVARISNIAYQFSTQGGVYDAVYRNKNRHQDKYHIIHAVGRHFMVGECRLSVITYTDETETMDHTGADQRQEAFAEALTDYLSRQGTAARISRFDDLTGLPNMTYFLQYAQEGIAKIRKEGRCPLIIYLDYNNIKAYNSRYGFAAGDDLIVGMGTILARQFGAASVSRFESDHFVVYTDNPETVSARLEHVFKEAERLNYGNAPSIKAGIYQYVNPEESLSLACDRARIACNSIRGQQKSTLVFFNADIQHQASIREHILRNFERAMREKWIKVYDQPVIRTMTRALCGVEALARWVDPQYGMIMPGQFIPVLEESGLIYKLDLYIFEEVCRNYQMLTQVQKDIVPVSVNLSRKDFEHEDVVDQINRIVQKYNAPRELINIEITESAFVEDVQRIGKAADQLHQLGFQVWMDDFGSGYSSLGILKDYAFDEIKIDMSFLSSFSEKSRIIIESAIRMAKKIGIQTLAEGVETEEQYMFLRSVGCEKIQGYYFGHPMPAGNINSYCATHHIAQESSQWKPYFDELGRINYMSDAPLCVVEDDGEFLHLLFTNQAYEDTLRRDHVRSVREWEQKINERNSQLQAFHRQFANQQLRKLTGPQTIAYPSGDHYMQLTASVVTHFRNHYIYQVSIQYIELSRELEEQRRTDLLSNLYFICDDIAAIDFNDDTVTSLKSSLSEQPMGNGAREAGIRRIFNSWGRQFVYPPDCERIAAFLDADTLEERVKQHKGHMICGRFRSKTAGGDYRWFLHIVQLIPRMEHQLLYVTIDSDLTNEEIDYIRHGGMDAYGLLPETKQSKEQSKEQVEAALWENLMMGDIGRFFWKDQNRRFLGASRSFLEYYGFASQQEILGKTDEDLGWHVNPGPFRKDEERVIEQGESVHGAVGDCIVRGRQHTILAYKNPLYCDGKIIGLLGRFVDTEEVIESMEHRSQWVTVDPISGLSNSTGIAATFRNYIESLWKEGKYFAVMQVRVPEYASFCQRYGEEAGNALLARLGQILSEIAGWHYVAGRISGSQFVLFIQQEPEEAVRALAEKIRNNIQTVHRLDGWQFACTVHITASFLNTENAGPDQYSRILDAIMAALGKAIEL